jgi:hypothetical protein
MRTYEETAMAKAKNSKIPKRIAGVKVPKELRNAADLALQLSRHPVVADIIAAGLLAAAAALKDSDAVKDAAKAAGDEADALRRSGGRAKRVVKAAAGAMGRSVLEEIKGSGKGSRSRRPM